MSRLMRPQSIAILGASSDAAKFSGRPLAYLRALGYAGHVYPVHPQAAEIAGYRCYRSIADIDGTVDVAVIARPAAHVPDEIVQCLARGIRAFVVFSGGFAEAGEEGAALQRRIVDLCQDAGAVLCGPNGTGVFDAASGAAMSFMSNLDRERAPGGTIALVSGSGSIAAMLYQGRGRVIRSVASIGNEAVTTAAEFIADAVAQPEIHGVIAFIEVVRDPQAMVAALRQAHDRGKPVAILKSGRSERSAQVAATHTGALVDDHDALQAMLEHHHAIRVDSLEELKVLAALMHAAATRSIGPGVGVLTPSGGTAVLIVDELDEHGLQLPAMADATRHTLQELIPESAPANPMDLTGFGASSRQIFAAAIDIMLADPAIDVLLVPMGGAVGATGALRASVLVEAAARTRKLLVPIWQATTREQAGYDDLLGAGLPVMTDYALPVAALGKLVRQRARARAGTSAGPAVEPVRLPHQSIEAMRSIVGAPDSSLSEPQVKALLAMACITVPAAHTFAVGGDTDAAARTVPFPAMLKVVSAQILHKSVVGGVRVVQSADELPDAIRGMAGDLRRLAPEASIQGYLLEEMVPGGLELLVGIRRDPRYGALLTLAAGGTWANALRGAVTALLPLDSAGAHALADRYFAKLDDPGARVALGDFLLRLSALAEQLGERLDVLEINPVKLFAGASARAVALDGVLTLHPPDARTLK